MSCLPPIAIPSLVISANPLVINAAKLLSPKSISVAIPAQKAIMFFNAPPSSTPITSSDVYTLIFSFMNVSCTKLRTSSSFEAITIAVGIPTETSSAWLGPENIPYFEFGISCSIIWLSVHSVSASKPFAHIIIG